MPIGSMLPSPFYEMWTRGLIRENLFSVYLSNEANSSTSYVDFGAANNDNTAGDYVTVAQSDLNLLLGYSAVTVTGLDVGGLPVANVGNVVGVCDTGTTLIAIGTNHPDVIAATNVSADCSNIDSLPVLSFHIGVNGLDASGGTIKLDLHPRMYTYIETFKDGSAPQCQNGLFAFDAGEGMLPLWILGDRLLTTFKTAFRRGEYKMSFAPAKP